MKEVLQTIDGRIEEIEDDSRYKAEDATVQINAPLALLQTEMEGELRGLYFVKRIVEDSI